jgi:hypothetical protein
MGFKQNGNVLTLDGIGGMTYAQDASGIGTGNAFLIGELEKRDPKLYEPLTSVTWQRDIVAKPGGGWVTNTSNVFVDYATTGGNQFGLISGQTNNIPIMQANLTKDNFKVVPWSNILKIPFIDQQRMQNIGRSLDDILNKGIKLNYNKSLDLMVYNGIPSENFYGLVNNPVIVASTVAVGGAGHTQWNYAGAPKTPDEILADINAAIMTAWANAQYDPDAIPNQILIPPVQYGYIVTAKVSSAGNVSILTYLEENNIAKNKGVNLKIVESRWCVGAGVGGTDRMVAYVNDEDKVVIDIPQPITRMFTQPSAEQMAYLTPFAANIGQVKFLYTQCANYSDGI